MSALFNNSRIEKSQKISNVVEFTNLKLEDWYYIAKEDYGVIGSGYCEFLNDEYDTLVIYYEENGVKCKFSVPYSLEYNNDYAYNIWAEKANPDNDRIN